MGGRNRLSQGESRRADVELGQLPRRRPRLTGVDVARGIAVLGMYAVHVGPDPATGGWDLLFLPFEGHSAALFAVLAGLSIALMSGGRTPKQGLARTKVSLRLATRAVLLFGLGVWLTYLDTGYLVILAYYGACFLLVLPCLRLSAKPLAIAALASAVVLPVLSFILRSQIFPRDLVVILPDITPYSFAPGGTLGELLLVLLLTGTFPAINLMTYILAGMALGRMDLTSNSVCRRLLFGGSGLAVAGYLVSWLATSVFGGLNRIYQTLEPAAAQAGMTPAEFFEQNRLLLHGTPPTTSWAWELLSTGASYTPFDFLISIGLAAAVIGGCQLLAQRYPRGLGPLADLGGRVLSAYVLHFVAIALLWQKDETPFSVLHFVEFSLVALTAAVAWRRWIGRGPLEWLLHVLSKWPNHLLTDDKIPAQRGK
ncbi:heparan-alpha-glucosaminide N-acetyltransferase domain-containing protein [Amycolatopsis nigrescens]|uniref:heparan-alpha-glucosaminide N-acetyltransferase domain-containing protein n=1 Tax=Amycolatopsis nigrescens TaxID=381445 RepID=UPI000688B64D|nr:heparan-alpha-glucosaminide N-acetyltransferase domain-containing protein [Amycolatopsis nigrescens]